MNSQLGARLKSMLLIDVDDKSESESSAFPSASVQDKNDAANAKKKILIEEVDDKETNRNNVRNLPAENVLVDPYLVTNEASSTLSTQSMQRIGVESMTNNTPDTPSSSLAEQMMTAAASAQTSQKERQRSEQQNRAKKATFGMKKGFLTKKKPSSTTTTKNVQVVGNSVCNVIEKVRKTFSRLFFTADENASLIVLWRILY
jgi:tRNA U34 5-methylaminomethyl-2-thiouridine-forming methyltransferase MnmC